MNTQRERGEIRTPTFVYDKCEDRIGLSIRLLNPPRSLSWLSYETVRIRCLSAHSGRSGVT